MCEDERQQERVALALAEISAEMSNGFRGTDRKIGVLSKNILDVVADIRELQDRVEKFESPPS